VVQVLAAEAQALVEDVEEEALSQVQAVEAQVEELPPQARAEEAPQGQEQAAPHDVAVVLARVAPEAQVAVAPRQEDLQGAHPEVAQALEEVALQAPPQVHAQVPLEGAQVPVEVVVARLAGAAQDVVAAVEEAACLQVEEVQGEEQGKEEGLQVSLEAPPPPPLAQVPLHVVVPRLEEAPRAPLEEVEDQVPPQVEALQAPLQEVALQVLSPLEEALSPRHPPQDLPVVVPLLAHQAQARLAPLEEAPRGQVEEVPQAVQELQAPHPHPEAP